MVSTIITARKRSCREGDVFTARKRSLGKCNILHLFVILFAGGVCLSACWETLPEEAPPGGDPPKEAPPGGDPQRKHPPEVPPPRHRACWEIQSTCWRYASYWNAILLHLSVILFTGWGGLYPSMQWGGGCLPLGPGGCQPLEPQQP